MTPVRKSKRHSSRRWPTVAKQSFYLVPQKLPIMRIVLFKFEFRKGEKQREEAKRTSKEEEQSSSQSAHVVHCLVYEGMI